MQLTTERSKILDQSRKISRAGLAKLRNAAREMFGDDQSIVIGVNGSYARREVTSGSDVDVFFLYDINCREIVRAKQQKFHEKIKKLEMKAPADGGVFHRPLPLSGDTIGGQKDKNKHITRRMLLLLEGEWILNERKFCNTRKRLIRQYVPETIGEKQICLFLLNDIIRYWRTICVDFEHKVHNENKAKAIRLIKLRFSRMLLFVAGVFAVGQTYKLKYENKIERLAELLALPPYMRIQRIIGDKFDRALIMYSEFLQNINDETIRDQLSQDYSSAENLPVYLKLRETAREFRKELFRLLKEQYEDCNPTFRSLVL